MTFKLRRTVLCLSLAGGLLLPAAALQSDAHAASGRSFAIPPTGGIHAQNAPHEAAILAPLPCSTEPSLQSVSADTATTVTFENQYGSAVNIYWLDYTGQRVRYQTLAAGAAFTQSTYVTHPWLATDNTDSCIAIFRPAATHGVAVIAQGAAILAPLPCSSEPSLQSVSADTATTVTFENETADALSLYWLDYNGQRVLYQTLTAGGAATQSTYVTHPWLATDSSGTCIAIFQPAATHGIAVFAR